MRSGGDEAALDRARARPPAGTPPPGARTRRPTPPPPPPSHDGATPGGETGDAHVERTGTRGQRRAPRPGPPGATGEERAGRARRRAPRTLRRTSAAAVGSSGATARIRTRSWRLPAPQALSEDNVMMRLVLASSRLSRPEKAAIYKRADRPNAFCRSRTPGLRVATARHGRRRWRSTRTRRTFVDHLHLPATPPPPGGAGPGRPLVFAVSDPRRLRPERRMAGAALVRPGRAFVELEGTA